MMTKKSFLFLMLAVILCPTFLIAQYNIPQSRVWAMATNAGLDFNTNPPTIIRTSLTGGSEGCTSVSDSSGKLLFYTNGTNVWSAKGIVMPKGTNINGSSNGTASTTQGALVVPDPAHPHRYYLLSLTAVSNCRLYCNVVDMTLNSGDGDIDTTFVLRGKMISNGLTEKMVAAPDCNGRVWVLVRSESVAEFKAYAVDSSGFNTTPVISQSGNFTPSFYTQGVLKVSPDSRKILTCNFIATFSGPIKQPGIEVHDFDRATGKVSNALFLDSASYYGGSFSADGTKVYAQTTTSPGKVYQFDLNAAKPSASMLNLGVSGQYTDLKLAPDQKIYFGALAGSPGYTGYRYMGRINYPDSTGLACGFQDSVTQLHFPNAAGTSGTLTQGLPNEVVVPIINLKEYKVVLDTVLCAIKDNSLVLSAPAGYSDYLWSDNSKNATLTAVERGTYWVTYASHCGTYTDTFKIKGEDLPLLALSVDLSRYSISTTQAYTTYTWYKNGKLLDGAKDSTLIITGNTSYSVVVANEWGCSDSVSIDIAGYTNIADLIQLKNTLTIYPNPAQNVVRVKAPVLLSLYLFNMEGKLLRTNDNDNHIDITSLAEGMYLLRMEDRNGNLLKTEKIIKSR